MKTKAIVKICLCSLLALVLTGVLLGALFLTDSGQLPFVRLDFGTYADAEEYTAGSGSISGTIRELEIHWASGSVAVSVHDGNEIVLRESGAKDDETMYWLLKNGRLTVRDRKSGIHWNGWESGHRTLEVLLPAAALRAVTVDSASADLTFSGLTADHLEVDTASASLTARGCILGSVEIDCASTDCEFLGCTLGGFEMDSASGSAVLNGSVEEIEFDAASGDLEVLADVTPRSIETSVVSGVVQLTLPADAGFRAELDSVSGDLLIDGFLGTYRGATFVCGNGEADYRFDSTSGDVHIQPAE